MTSRRTFSPLFLGLCLLAVLTVVGAYSNAFNNTFHFDDSHVVEGNAYIRSLGNMGRFFTDGTTSSAYPPNAVYRPVMTASLAVDYYLGGGLVPRQFHTTQVMLLLVLGVLLYFFFLAVLARTAPKGAWNPWVALALATFFSVHTTNTETMNIIAVRAELFSAIGVIGAFLVYLDFPFARRTYLYLLPMVFGALAKSPAVIFAPLLVMYVLLYEEQLSAHELLTGVGWAKVWKTALRCAPALVIGGVLFVVIESMNGPAATYAGGNRWLYAQTQAWIWLHYGKLFLLPMGLTADSDWGLITDWYDTRVLAGLAFIGALVWATLKSTERVDRRPIAFGLAWFILALIPASSFIPLAEVTNNHRMFFPYIGLVLAAGWALVLWLQRLAAGGAAAVSRARLAGATLALVFIAGNAVGTYERNKDWLTGETLWKDVSEKSPNNGRGLMNYGVALMRVGRYDEAKALFERAGRLNPNYDRIEINLGIIAGRTDPVEATQHFERALKLAPNDPVPHHFYAVWLVGQKRSAEAIPLLERAIQLSSADVNSRHELLHAYLRVGRKADAKRLAAETLAVVPDDAVAKAVAADQLAVPSEAPGSAPQTAQSEPTPTTAGGFLDLSLARYQRRDYTGSIDAAREVLKLDPQSAEAWNNIAAASASLGKWDDGVQAAQAALRIKPNFELAKNNLAWAEDGKRKAQGR